MTAEARAEAVEAACWLEDQHSERTRDWTRLQNRRTRDHLASLALQPWIDELLADTVHTSASSEVRRHGPWRLHDERLAEAPWIRIIGEHDDGTRRSVFTPAPGPRTDVRSWSASPDGSWLAVQVVVAGREDCTPLHLINLDRPGVLPVVHEVRHTPLYWIDDNTLVYVSTTTTRGTSVVSRSMTSGQETVLFSAPSPGWNCQVRVWHRRWVTLALRDGAAPGTVVHWLDLQHTAPAQPQPVQSSPDAATLGLVDSQGRLLLLTNHEAPGGRLVRPGDDPADRSQWTTLVGGQPEHPLIAADVLRSGGDEHLVLVRKTDGRTEVEVRDPLDLGSRGAFTLPGPGAVSVGRDTRREGQLSLRYADWVTPPTELEIDARHRRLRLSPDGPRPVSGVRFEQGSCVSSDGVAVPFLWLGPDDRTGPVPTILTVYGGFGRSVQPSFQTDNIAWVRAGGAVVVADVRGGGGHGSAWHRAGMGENKQRSIDDLHAVAEALVRTRRAAPDQLVLLGSSHGGLIVTAALVQRPALYAAGVAVAPLTDMSSYEASGLGPAWRAEFGVMAEPHQRSALLGYSPCHNVRHDRHYPPLLLLAGENDTRVDAAHARKLAHLLQQADPEGGPFLVHQVAESGHACDSATTVELGAMTLAFLATHSGLTAAQPSG